MATGNFPVWSPDGAVLAFASNRDGFYNLYVKPSTGAGQETMLFRNEANKFIGDWSRDGRYLLYAERRRGSYISDFWLLPMLGDRKPILYLRGSSDQRDARFSPDGRWVAYSSTESSSSQVYVQSIPAGSEKVQISTSGGTRPRWRSDGKELYYVDSYGELMAVDVKAGAHFAADDPKPLFSMSSYIEHGYAPARGGQRFVMLAPEDDSSEPLMVTLNWTRAIKQGSRK
jgi:Tol biopolymer transport system component